MNSSTINSVDAIYIKVPDVKLYTIPVINILSPAIIIPIIIPNGVNNAEYIINFIDYSLSTVDSLNATPNAHPSAHLCPINDNPNANVSDVLFATPNAIPSNIACNPIAVDNKYGLRLLELYLKVRIN